MAKQASPHITRCPWVDLDKPDYVAYHDEEWGVPVHDDRRWFEFLTLESAQAGLSWYTILRKRDGYRRLFVEFDVQQVASFTPSRIDKMLTDPAIVRNRKKVEAAVRNARHFIEIQSEFGSFENYIWRFTGGETIVNQLESMSDYPTTSAEAEALSKDLKKRGFSFVGPTIMYAHMQATGMVNDHVLGCPRRIEIIRAYRQNETPVADRSDAGDEHDQ